MKQFSRRKNFPQRFSFAVCMLVLLFSAPVANAQGSWTYAGPVDGAGNGGAETGKGICADASGNVYVTGVFTGTSDFDLATATASTYTSQAIDGYVASYDKNGVFRWKVIVSGVGNDFGSPSGAVCTNGTFVWFTGTVNMGGGSIDLVNPGLGSTVAVTGNAANGADAIVGKLSCSNGAIIWGTPFGGAGADNGQGICVDPNGCCYTIGAYANSFVKNSITVPVTTGGAGSDLYTAKYSPSGILLHVGTGGASGVGDMGVDGAGICYAPGATPQIVAVGSFGAGTATYGSFTGITSSGANDAVLLELDSSLAFTNAMGFGTGGTDELLGATYDPFSGGVYVCGLFAGATGGTISLPGAGALTSAGVGDAMIARYSTSLNSFTWARSGGGTSNDYATAITADGQGGILVTGLAASAPATFGSLSLSAGGADDIFLLRYNPSGIPVWILSAGGTGGDDGRGVASYIQTTPPAQYVYITGNYQNTVTFGAQPSLVADGGNDFFLARALDASVPLSATQSQVNLTCNGVCTGSATVVASGGTAPYTYSWSPSGGSGATASSLCATNYTVTITDAASSSITKTFSLTQPPAIVITPVSQTNVSCFGGSNGAAQVTASGGTGTLTYNWTPGNPAGDGTGSVTGLTAQVYTVTVTDANSCTATRTFNITQPSSPVSGTTVVTNVACFGGNTGAINLTPTGGTGPYTFNWLPSGPTTEDRTGLIAGTYSVQITDVNGCTGTVTATVTQPTSPVSGTTVVTNVACFGGNTGAINLTPSGGTGPYTFNWLPSGPTTEDRTGLIAGTYSVQITDVNGCTGTVTATVTQPTSPVSGTTVVTNVACFGGNTGAINLTPTGGTGPYTFNWLPSGPTTEDRTGLIAGTYSVQITDVNGCTGTVTATVTQPTTPVSGTTVVTNVACFGGNTGAINLTPTGGTGPYTFNWLPSGPTTEDRTGLIAGTYSVQITDVNGCTGTVTATVTQPTSPVSGTTVVTNVACFGGNTGAINLTPTGGTGPYTFNWLPSGPTTEDRTGLTAGTYSVQITDVNGCTGTVTATVTQPTSPVSGTTVVTNVSCFGGNNGSINLTPTGGTGPYTFNWLPSGPTTEDRTGLIAGTYSVQITDVNGCTGTVTATVTQPTSPVSGTTVVTNVACFGGNTGAINLTPTGGTGPYTFNWLPSGPTTEDRTGLVAGTYTVIITDTRGCTGTVTATVTQPTSPVSGTTVVTNVACFGGNTGAINLTPTGGTGPYTFNWLPSGPTTEDRTGLTAGTYTVIITDLNGCTGTVTATVTQPTSPVSGTTVVTNVACFGGNTGAINLTPTGGTGPGTYTFNWLPSGPTTEDRTGLTAGTYSVIITDANGCTGTVTATVTQPTSPVSGTTVVTNVSCFGGSNGAINLTPSGGTGPGTYTFNWLPSGPTTEDRTGLTAGTYTVIITDVNGCTGTVTATVTQPTSPVSGTTVVTNVSCFGGSNGAINLTPSGGTGPGTYTFNWLPSGPTTEDRTGLTAGTYSVIITDANGCTGTVTATVTQPTTPVSGTTVVTNVACFGGNTGAINLTPTGGTGPGTYTFNWLPSGPTTEDRTGLTAGTYSVIITDANGCTGTVTATVTQPSTPVSGTTVVTNVACFGGNTGAINLTPTGGTGPGTYTFNWLPSGPTTEDRTGLTAGTYSVIITDANGCTGTVTATVTQPTTPVSGTTVVTNVSCFGGSNGAINLTPSGGTGPGTYTFNWLPSGPTTEDRTGLTAGTYSVIITDANGCTGTVTATVTQPTTPVSGTTVVTNVACFGGNTGAINLTPTGGTGPGTYTFNWLPSGPTTEDRTGLAAGTYSVIITDANGCTGTVTATVTQPSTPVSGTTVVTNVSCFGGSNGSINLTPSGGTGPGTYTFNWLPSGPITEDRTGLTAGTYSVIITDANGCTATVTVTVTQPPLIVVTAASQTNVSCFGGSNGAASVTAAGGTGTLAYNWTPGNPTGDGTNSVTGLTAGVWTVTVTDINSCTGSASFNITQPPVITVTPASQTNVSCFGGSNGAASVIATGGTGAFGYNWTPGNPTGDGTNSVTGLTAGSYTVTVTDANSCVSSASFIITAPTPLAVTSSQTNLSCNGGNNGTATVAVTGGTGAYTYAWIPTGGNNATATGLSAMGYTVTITDANLCSTTATFLLTEPTAITYASMQTDVSCNGGSNGTAMVMASGGTGTLTYAWSSGGNAATETGLAANTYTVVITDANACSVSASFTITEPPAITFTTSQSDASCNGGSNGTATVNASGGTGTLTYAWSSGGNAATETGLAAGSYTVIITDANGCAATATFSITEPAAITFTSSQIDVSCNGGSNGEASVVASGGTGTLTYAWSSGGNAATETALSAGGYTVIITDANACTATATFVISEPSAITYTSSQLDVSCNGGSNGEASVVATGGTGTLTYAWSSGGNAATETGLSASSYTVVITDANGCSATATFQLTEPNAITYTASQIDISCNGGNNGEASVVATGGTGVLAYTWSSGGNTATETALTAGGYTVIITDENGCSATATFLLTEPGMLVATVDSTLNPSACTAANGAVYISVSGGTGAYLYTWSDGSTNEDLTGAAAGSYNVMVTDSNGCTTTASANINDPGAPLVTLSLPIDTACGSFPGTITLSGESPAGGIFSGTTVSGNTFDPFAAGNGVHYITYTFTDINGCTASATDSLTVDQCSGIATVTATQQWNLFPNPTSGMLTIVSAENVNGNVVIDVLGTDGKLIISETKSGNKNITLDISTQPVGVYFIRITGNETVSVYRVVKM